MPWMWCRDKGMMGLVDIYGMYIYLRACCNAYY